MKDFGERTPHGETPPGKESPLQKIADATGKNLDVLRYEFDSTIERGLVGASWIKRTEDPDNLLVVGEWPPESYSRTFTRTYYRYDDGFEMERHTSLSLSDEFGEGKVRTTWYGKSKRKDYGDYEVLDYSWTGSRTGMDIYKEQASALRRFGRGIELRFDQGELFSIEFNERFERRIIYEEGKWKIPPLVGLKLVDEGSMLKISLSEEADESAGGNPNAIDRFVIPTHIDITALRRDIYPGELLKNPASINPKLDEGSILSPFSRIAAKWQTTRKQ